MENKVLLVLVVLGVFDVVSIFVPVTALLLVYVLYAKPRWFKKLVARLYEGSGGD